MRADWLELQVPPLALTVAAAIAVVVTEGVYRWTRNPMYLGFVMLLLGLAIALQSTFGLLVTALSASFLHRFQIAPEKRWLGKQCGAEFDAYRARVRRWL